MLATPPNFLTHLFAFSLLRLSAVLQLVRDGRTKFYEDMAAGLWPQPVSTSGRSVAWPAAEIAAVNAARIAGASDDEIRALVAKLHVARKDMPKLVADLYFGEHFVHGTEANSDAPGDHATGTAAMEAQ